MKNIGKREREPWRCMRRQISRIPNIFCLISTPHVTVQSNGEFRLSAEEIDPALVVFARIACASKGRLWVCLHLCIAFVFRCGKVLPFY